MTQLYRKSAPSRFTLQTLMAFTAFVAMSLWAWNHYGPAGIGCLCLALVVLLANIFVGLGGAQLRIPVLAGMAGGVVLWSLFAVTVHGLRIQRFDDAAVFLLTASLTGLVCGGYAKFKHQQLSSPARSRIAWGVGMLAALSICWIGWRYHTAQEQRKVVRWLQTVGGTVHYSYQDAGDGSMAGDGITPPYPHWLRNWLGIEFFSDIVSVDVSAHRSPVQSVAPLARLRGVKNLSIRSRLVTDLSPLAGLQDLTHLSLQRTAVSDLTPLGSLRRLESLQLRGATIDDISPLARLTNLKGLSLVNTGVSDLSSLARMTNLELLDLRESAVSDLSPLAQLPLLSDLYLDGTPTRDVSPLANLPSLRRLSLQNTTVTDVTPLAGLMNLEVQPVTLGATLSNGKLTFQPQKKGVK